jgi:hypothetical protein
VIARKKAGEKEELVHIRSWYHAISLAFKMIYSFEHPKIPKNAFVVSPLELLPYNNN